MTADLPRFDELPIPAEVTIGTGWSPLMVEIADHIGAYATLKLLECYGGEEIRVSRTEAMRRRIAKAIGEDAAERFTAIFAPAKLDLPTGFDAIRRAKSQPIIEQVRAGHLTIADAARILRTSRKRIHERLSEGEATGAPRRRRARPVDPRQIDMFVAPSS